MCGLPLRVLPEVRKNRADPALSLFSTSSQQHGLMGILQFLEQTSLARFINESNSAFAFSGVLFVHVLGLSMLAGANTVVSIRMLGVASTIPLQPLKRMFPLMWAGFIMTLISGVGLVIAKATEILTNPVVLIKLVLIVIATAIMWVMQKKVFRSPGGFQESKPGNAKTLAAAELVLWFFVIILGRLIAYKMAIFE